MLNLRNCWSISWCVGLNRNHLTSRSFANSINAKLDLSFVNNHFCEVNSQDSSPSQVPRLLLTAQAVVEEDGRGHRDARSNGAGSSALLMDLLSPLRQYVPRMGSRLQSCHPRSGDLSPSCRLGAPWPVQFSEHDGTRVGYLVSVERKRLYLCPAPRKFEQPINFAGARLNTLLLS